MSECDDLKTLLARARTAAGTQNEDQIDAAQAALDDFAQNADDADLQRIAEKAVLNLGAAMDTDVTGRIDTREEERASHCDGAPAPTRARARKPKAVKKAAAKKPKKPAKKK